MRAATEPIAVNTGPLIALAACDSLDLLSRLHPRVLVPTAVVEEFCRGSSEQSLSLPAWIEVRSLATSVPALLISHLDIGEASAIALALEAGIRLVAMDERRGRLVARDMGLSVTGSVGVLLRAKHQGLIEAIAPRLEAMKTNGIWLSEPLVRRVLTEAGEWPLSRSSL